MTEDAWYELAADIRYAMEDLRYGTGDYAIMSVARMVALVKIGEDGASIVTDEWSRDRRILAQKNRASTT